MARFSGGFPKNYDVFQASGGYQQEPEIQAWRAFPWVSLRKVHKNMVASISLGTFAIKLCTFRLPAGHRRIFIHSLASAKRSASPGGGISVMARMAGHRQGRQGGQGGSFILSLACRHPRQCFARPCPCLCRQPDAAAAGIPAGQKGIFPKGICLYV